MPKGNKRGSQKELIRKLETIQVLAKECMSQLSQQQRLRNSPSRRVEQALSSARSLDFESNARAFVKLHAKGLSGPKKFVLLLAYLTKGDPKREISLGDIKKLWNTMKSKSLLGMKFNLFFPNSAKENGWVGSTKRGLYNLDRSWKRIFANG